MSTFPNPPADNPYNSPQNWQSPYQAQQPLKPLPTFCTVMFITDLIIAVLRIPLVALGVVGYFALRDNDPNNALMATVMFEIATGFALVLTSLPADIGLLMKQRWAIVAGYLACAATIASMIVGLWQLVVTFQGAPRGPEQAAVVIGAVVAIGFRVAILGGYFAALRAFAAWKNDPQRVAAENSAPWTPPATY